MQVITQPTIEPITLADVKSQLGIKAIETSQDSVIVRRISEARQFAEDYMQRGILQTVRELRFNFFPTYYESLYQAIKLPFPNLLGVVSVKYIDTLGVEQTMQQADYTVDAHSRCIYPVYGTTWPSTRDEIGAVRIQYKTGYDVYAVAGAKTITAATNASPGVFTSVAHGFADGEIVKMASTGMVEIDGLSYRVINKTADTFQLADLSNTYGISTSSFGVFATCTATKSQTYVPELMKEALLLLVGHWMNNQPQSENGTVVSRVPYAIRDLFDKYSVVTYV